MFKTRSWSKTPTTDDGQDVAIVFALQGMGAGGVGGLPVMVWLVLAFRDVLKEIFLFSLLQMDNSGSHVEQILKSETLVRKLLK